MQHPTYARFMNEVENIIKNLSRDDLVALILRLAENQHITLRNQFIVQLKNSLSMCQVTDTEDVYQPELTPEEFFGQIEEFKQRIEDGEFFDEDENERAYYRDEHSYWRDNYYEDDDEGEIDFANEEYVTQMEEFLDTAQDFYHAGDVATALKAYEMLFQIMEDAENNAGETDFIYGFSYQKALDSLTYQENRIFFLRCQYLSALKTRNFEPLFQALIKENEINLTQINEIERDPLPEIALFVEQFIEFLHDKPRYDRHLVDALMIKGGIEAVKSFAYAHGSEHPPVVLYYFNYATENHFPQAEIKQFILDGINIIPAKYRSRELLSQELINIAKTTRDQPNLRIGYSSAFYSHPSLENLVRFFQYLQNKNLLQDQMQLKQYLQNKFADNHPAENYSSFSGSLSPNVWNLEESKITSRTLIIGRYLFEGIEPLFDLIDPNVYLGFSRSNNHVAVTLALLLKTLAGAEPAIIVDTLISHYCLQRMESDAPLLQHLVAQKARENSLSREQCIKLLERAEILARKRVAKILGDKLRGGYDSACLLIVACAEVKQVLTQQGNQLIAEIDSEYRRFAAFRRPLKEFTRQSKVLRAV